jgi:hypothetical protein
MEQYKDLCRLLLVTGAVIFFLVKSPTAQRGSFPTIVAEPAHDNGAVAVSMIRLTIIIPCNWPPAAITSVEDIIIIVLLTGVAIPHCHSCRYRPIYRSYGICFGPAFGFRLSILPFGYSPFLLEIILTITMRIYYRPYSNPGDTSNCSPPHWGATVKHLPSGAKPICHQRTK